MAFSDRVNYEKNFISPLEFIMNTCVQCRYWSHFVRKEYSYCKRCINNLHIPIKNEKGISLEGLYDYYTKSDLPEKIIPLKKNKKKSG